MASVAMLRFWSEIRDSMSTLQLATASGCAMATCRDTPQKVQETALS